MKGLIVKILEHKQHPEQAYKSCMGVLSLEKKVGPQRLGRACKRALEYGIHNYQTVQNILERGLDTIEASPLQVVQIPPHNNIRGNKYYS